MDKIQWRRRIGWRLLLTGVETPGPVKRRRRRRTMEVAVQVDEKKKNGGWPVEWGGLIQFLFS